MVTDIMVTPNGVTFMVDRDRSEAVKLTHSERLLLNEYLIKECTHIYSQSNTWEIRPLYFCTSGFYASRIALDGLTPGSDAALDMGFSR